MTTNQKGNITESQVMAKILELGYSVSIPFGNSDKYDQIWDIDGKLIRVQIKTSRWKNIEDKRALTFTCKSTCNGKAHFYSKKDIDFFATCWEGKVYAVPVEECSSEKALWFQPPLNHSKVSYAQDYEVAEVLKRL